MEPDHKCKFPKLYLMHGNKAFTEEKLGEIFFEDSMDSGEPSIDPIVTEVPEHEISLHVIVGALSPNTMWLVGMLRNHRVVILLDSGSTRSFLDPAVLTL